MVKEQHIAYAIIAVVLVAVSLLAVTGKIGSTSAYCDAGNAGELNYIFIGHAGGWDPDTITCRKYVSLEERGWTFIGCKVDYYTGRLNHTNNQPILAYSEMVPEGAILEVNSITPSINLHVVYQCIAPGVTTTTTYTTSTRYTTSTTYSTTTIPSTTTTYYTTSTTQPTTTPGTTTTIPGQQGGFDIGVVLHDIWDAVFGWWWPW